MLLTDNQHRTNNQQYEEGQLPDPLSSLLFQLFSFHFPLNINNHIKGGTQFRIVGTESGDIPRLTPVTSLGM